MESKRVYAIINPRAGGGKTGKSINAIIEELSRHYEGLRYFLTERPLHATELTRKAIDEGGNLIICVGGDGTLNEVVNGFFDGKSSFVRDVGLSVISTGTGADFLKAFGIKKGFRILEGREIYIDGGICEFTGLDGKEKRRAFINITDFGIGGEVVYRVNRTTKVFGGFVSFLIGTLSALTSYRGAKVRYRIDDEERTERLMGFVIAIGQFFGGGMHIAPLSDPSDGLFDIVIMKRGGLRDFIRFGPRIYRGTHLNVEGIYWTRGKTVSAEVLEGKCPIDMDGEDVGSLPLRAWLIPNAIKLVL